MRFTGGQKIKAKDIYEMVDTAFGVVASEKNTFTRETYILNVAGTAAGNTEVTAAQTLAAAKDLVKNPTMTVGGDATCGDIVFLTLCFAGGQTISPLAIYEMVDATYGTVATVEGSAARNTYVFNIEA